MPSCKKSHDVCRAVLLEDQKKSKKRKRKDESNTCVPKEVDVFVGTANTFPRQERFKGHRAGHDAFMTAFCFASFIAQKTSSRPDSSTVMSTCWKDLVADVRNRICLSGKDFPLLIQKSAFAKCSKFHLEKYSRLVSEQPDLGS